MGNYEPFISYYMHRYRSQGAVFVLHSAHKYSRNHLNSEKPFWVRSATPEFDTPQPSQIPINPQRAGEGGPEAHPLLFFCL